MPISGIIAVTSAILMTTDLQPTEIIREPEPIEVVQEYELIGDFKLTAYCGCEKCCGKWAKDRPNGIVVGAIGEELIAGYSIAVDPEVIPYGTEVIIDGQSYEAMDCGVKNNRIDVYFTDHDEAVAFGVKYADVYQKILN